MGDIANLTLGWRTVMMGMICLPILICAIILGFRQIEKSASRFLAAFLLAAVLAVGPQIIGYAGFYNVWPGLTYFPLFYTELWLGPLIYLHANRLMRGGPLGWRKYLLLPGLVQIGYYVWAFFGLGDYQAKWAYNKAVHHPYIFPIEKIVGVGLMVFAMIAIWRLVRFYRSYLDQTSSAALEFNPVWLRNLILGLLIGGGIFAGLELISALRPVSYDAAFPFQVLTMLVMAWIAIDAVWRLAKSFPKMAGHASGQNETASESSRDWAKEGRQLQAAVLSNEWFLEPRLSIRDLAARMGTNESYLSRALNQGLGQSFNRFINGLRVAHAKKLLKECDTSLLSIAYDSGFNSKATFNRVFREIAGQTPSLYKKSQNP